MAGYMRLALKVILGTAAVGGLGGGGYYAANNGWLPALARGEGSALESTAAEPGVVAGNQPAELDAVASAWAQPLPTERAAEPAEASPVAHSASESLARAEEAAAAKKSSDRYGIYPSMLTTTAAAEESIPVDANAQDSAVNAAQADSEYVRNEQPAAVARGQEPPEETTSAQDSVAAEIPAGDANVTPDAATDQNFAEPNPFNASPGEPARKPVSQRARDAFREQPSATTPSASDRYGAPARRRPTRPR